MTEPAPFTRRTFLRQSGLLLATPLLPAHASAAPLSSRWLKTEARYRSEAAAFESAIRSLAGIRAGVPVTLDAVTELSRITQAASLALGHQHSRLAVLALDDAAFRRAVATRLPSEAAFKRFVSDLLRDPRSVDSLVPAADLRTRMSRLVAGDRATALRAAAALGIDPTDSRIQQERDAAVCIQTWSIVAAVVVVVVATVAAATTMSAAAAMGEQAATTLEGRYAGTGADLFLRALEAADARHASCIARIVAKTDGERARARLQCHARWLAERAQALA